MPGLETTGTIETRAILTVPITPAGFDAESEEEVTVVPGDEVIVHVEVEGWFQVTRVSDQTRGLVPASYVQVV